MLRNELFGKSGLRLFAYISLLYLASSELYATVTCSAKLNSASENERYELFASHPSGWTIPSGKFKYEYKLYDHHNNKDVWKFTLHNYPPKKLYVNNDGWVVIWNWQEELTFIRIDGTKTGQTENLHWSSDKDRKYVTVFSTGGSLWASFSYSYFHNWDDKSYFVIRTWWDRHFIFDLEKGHRILGGKALEVSIEKAERDFVIHTLKEGITHKDYLSQSGFHLKSVLPQIRTQHEDDKTADKKLIYLKRDFPVAAHMAGRMKINEAIPLLRKLEDVSYCGTIGSGYAFLRYRQVIQLSLRRLGEKPNSFPSTLVFTYSVVEGKKRAIRYDFVPSHLPRDKNVSKLKAGMQVTDVLYLLGYPDFVSTSGKDIYWEYDIDTKKPYSLLLTWDKKRLKENNAFLKTIKKIRPAVWKYTPKRDKAIVY